MLTAAYINSCGWVPRAQLLTAEAGCRELVQLASRVASKTSFNGFYRPRALAPEPRISGASRCSYGIRQSRAAVSRASLCLHPPNIQPRCHGPASVYIPRIYSRSVTGQPLPAGSGKWKSRLLDDLTRLRSNLIGSLHICGAGTRRLLCPSRASASHRAPRVPRPDAASPRDNRPLPLTPHTQGGGGGWAAAVTGLGRVAARPPPGPSRRWASFHVAASRPAVTGRPGAGCTRGPSRARVAGCPVSAPRGLATRTGPLLRGLAPALSESRRAPIRVSQGPYPSLAGPLSESRRAPIRVSPGGLAALGPCGTAVHAASRIRPRVSGSRQPPAQRRGPAQRPSAEAAQRRQRAQARPRPCADLYPGTDPGSSRCADLG